MRNAVIISGGRIEEDFALSFLKKKRYDHIIAADRGLLFLHHHHILPSHIVGDFDSASAAVLEPYQGSETIAIRRFRPEKDWTDTEIAVEQALELGCGTIDILGGTGSRMDHMFANLQVLALALERGADCRLVDSHNMVYMRDRQFTVRRSDQWGTFLSLFAYGGDVTGLTLRGVKYPVKHFTLGTAGSRGVSNEITAETAEIDFETGKLLVMETKD